MLVLLGIAGAGGEQFNLLKKRQFPFSEIVKIGNYGFSAHKQCTKIHIFSLLEFLLMQENFLLLWLPSLVVMESIVFSVVQTMAFYIYFSSICCLL